VSSKPGGVDCNFLNAGERSPSKPFSSFPTDQGIIFDPRFKITLCFLLGLLGCLWFTPATFGFPQRAKSNDPSGATTSIAGTVNVITGSAQVSNLAGVTVKLSGPSAGPTAQSTLTDDNGHFQFTQLSPGSYLLEVSVQGFKTWSKTIALEPDQAATENPTVEIIAVDEQIEVQGESLEVATHSAELTATVNDRQIETLPLAKQKFTEALPLTPGVIRTHDGKLNFNGQSENQGILLVTSTETVDPATGSFTISVPIDVIQSMSVHSFPDTAEYGGFSGGLTEIVTKPPFDAWDFKLHDLTPSFRGKNDHLAGIGEFTPRLIFGGPLIEGKLNFTEELTYEVNNLEVRGLSWPVNETKTRSVTSFTQLQLILSPKHLLDINLNVFPLRTQFANIDALVPQSASSDYGQNGMSVAVSDSYQLNSGGVLNTVFRYTRFDSHAHGQGPDDMLVTPDGWGGDFFNSWYRNASELEIRPSFQLANKNWHGRHDLKIGMDASRRSFVGSSTSLPVQVLGQDRAPVEQINFQGPGHLNGTSTEVGEFVEDHWILDTHVAVNMGARLSTQSIGRSAALGPHIGVAYSPRQNGKTVIRAGAGSVYGHVPLLAASFLDNPTRVISYFDPSGAMIGEPITLQNAYQESNGESAAQIGSQIPRTSARTFTWSAEIDREIWRNVSLKVSYLDGQTRNLFVIDPLIGAAGSSSFLALANTGAERYRRVEATLHAQPFNRGYLNVTYMWSRSRGDLNTLSNTYMPFEEPVIRPNVSGILPSDVPNRILAWGVFQLPFKLTLSPVVDVRSGLPYSNVDVLQNYVGVPNGLRFPTYFSLDARIYREFPLRLPFMERSTKRKIRFGVYTLNLTNRQNPHEVYSNVASPLFGQFAGLDKRIDGLVIDVVD
jgi:hypothetical protein